MQEIIQAINLTGSKISEICFTHTSDLVCSWVLTFLDIKALKSLSLNNVSLSFMEQLNRVLKTSTTLEKLEFISCKVQNKSNLNLFHSNLANCFPRLKHFSAIDTNFRGLLGDVFIECIPSTKDKSVELLQRKKLNLETFIVEDDTIARTYLENVYLDVLRLCDPSLLKTIHVRCGPQINFSKYSPTLSFFFEEIDRFKNLESLKIVSFDLEEENLIEFYIDTLQGFHKLKHLDLS